MQIKITDLILAEDEHLVAINKPSGMLTIPDREGKEPALKGMLQQHYGEIFTVHRLDRDTSGLVVFARTEAMHRHLSMQFESRETKKIYNGFVLGVPARPVDTINEPIAEHPVKKGMMTVFRKGKESITVYETLASFRFYSWMQFHILTGRTHQIRVHMKHLGHPIVCDPLYGDGKPVFISGFKPRFKLSQQELEERPLLNRLALHASTLSFKGLQGEDRHLEAPLPRDLRALLQQLGKQGRKS
jgi:23S rRNA pseudouridine1911/1915/1917 synthase